MENQATYQVNRPSFPSGVKQLDALASFMDGHCLSPGSSISNDYGVARVLTASQGLIDAIEAGRDYDPFQSETGEFALCQVRVSMERSWVDAVLAKAVVDAKTALLTRRMLEGPICDDDVPQYFDSIGFDYKIDLHSAGGCSATLWIWWEAK